MRPFQKGNSFWRLGAIAPMVIRWTLLLLCLLPAFPFFAPGQSQSSRDITFFVLSDVHVGEERLQADPPITPASSRARILQALEVMRSLPGKPYPANPQLTGGNLDSIAVPRGLLILGDLTDGHKDQERQEQQWDEFEDLFPSSGVRFGEQNVPVFAGAGNHDGDLDGPQRQGLMRRNRALQSRGELAAISTNAFHFALLWGGVHLLNLNLCPADGADNQAPFKYGQPGQGSWNDPQGASTFLKDYLIRNVGGSGDPVILMHHYGFDGFSVNDWNWWSPRQRRAYYELLAAYNVVAIFHGHNHHAEHYRWPNPNLHAADLQVYFDGNVPDAYLQYDVLSCGSLCWVVRLVGDQMIAVHFKGAEWPGSSRDYFLKSLKPSQKAP